MPNIYSDDLEERDHDGFRARRRRVGDLAGSSRLGASLWEVPPGELSYPYHYHLGEEEMIVVLDGDGELRTVSGWRPLIGGEVVSFRPGPDGAHQLRCHGPAPLRFLAISVNVEPEVVVYPDSDKVLGRHNGADVFAMFRRGDAVDYWDGESADAVPS
jgi:uncharacterized cupin superfamily protein